MLPPVKRILYVVSGGGRGDTTRYSSKIIGALPPTLPSFCPPSHLRLTSVSPPLLLTSFYPQWLLLVLLRARIVAEGRGAAETAALQQPPFRDPLANVLSTFGPPADLCAPSCRAPS